MKAKIVNVLCLLLLSIICSAQSYKLKEYHSIDTLNVSLSISDKIDLKVKQELINEFNNQILRFNLNNHSFYLKYDSLAKQNFIHMKLDSIKYVTSSTSAIALGADILLLAGHVIMISNFGWTIPILPILTPGINGNLELSIDPKLSSADFQKSELMVSRAALFMKKQKQNKKFVIKFGKKIGRFYLKLDKQNQKNK